MNARFLVTILFLPVLLVPLEALSAADSTGTTPCGSQTCSLGQTCTADLDGTLYCAGGVRTNTPTPTTVTSPGTINNTGNPIVTSPGTVNTAPTSGDGLYNPLGTGASLPALLSAILAFVVRIGAIIVVLMLVYVGFLFVTARGEPGKITTARAALLWTVVGGLVLLGAQAIAIAIQATVQAISTGG